MGAKSGYIILIFLAVQLSLKAQAQLDFQYVDTTTYRFYLKGDWDKLISVGNDAINHEIDYKYLRQRLGYAYFVKEDYLNSKRHFLKALSFDGYDQFTLEYLYYSYLNTGQEDAAVMIAGRMGKGQRKSMKINLYKPVESVDAEYNFKYVSTDLRSNPQYYHFGVSTQLGSRFKLYQMVAGYEQTVTLQLPVKNSYVYDDQFEYYALLRVNLTSDLSVRTAYHYLNTSYSLTNTSANLGYIGLTKEFSNITLGGEASLLYINQNYVKQFGLQAGISSPGLHNLYFNGSFSLITESEIARTIYTQRAGLKIKNWIWLEANATFGDLNNFNDFSSMYVYNSIDPTTFRTGITAFFYSGKHLSIWVSYAYERKDFYEDINYHYNQFSYLGGIKWKI